jgi:hypothetical protein
MTKEIKDEVHAWLELQVKGVVHYHQDGDPNTRCGMSAKFLKATPAKDFVTCPNCKQGTIRH